MVGATRAVTGYGIRFFSRQFIFLDSVCMYKGDGGYIQVNQIKKSFFLLIEAYHRLRFCTKRPSKDLNNDFNVKVLVQS